MDNQNGKQAFSTKFQTIREVQYQLIEAKQRIKAAEEMLMGDSCTDQEESNCKQKTRERLASYFQDISETIYLLEEERMRIGIQKQSQQQGRHW